MTIYSKKKAVISFVLFMDYTIYANTFILYYR